MASTFAGSVSLAKKRFTCKISPLYDIRFLSYALVCPENFKCPSPFVLEPLHAMLGNTVGYRRITVDCTLKSI